MAWLVSDGEDAYRDPATEAARAEARRGAARLLVVEDDAALAATLCDLLREAGYDVMSARHGAEAVNILRATSPPDVILLDLMMPVMDGWEVMTALAANPEYSQKVILVSAKASDDAQLQGWELGADEYITKPFDLDALLQRVRDVAARSEAESEARRAEAISELQNL